MYNGIVDKCRGPSGQPDGSSFYGGNRMKNPFSGLFRARDKPQDSTSAAPVFHFGTWTVFAGIILFAFVGGLYVTKLQISNLICAL